MGEEGDDDKEEEYEDDFDDDFEEEDDRDNEDLYGEGVKGSVGSTEQLRSISTCPPAAGGQRVPATRPLSAKCSDALDFQRRQQGLEEEDIVEEAPELEDVGDEKDVDDDGFVKDEIAEESDGDGNDGASSFETAAQTAQVDGLA